jgi:hypothetical protein
MVVVPYLEASIGGSAPLKRNVRRRWNGTAGDGDWHSLVDAGASDWAGIPDLCEAAIAGGGLEGGLEIVGIKRGARRTCMLFRATIDLFWAD